jgi:hypothetical protein
LIIYLIFHIILYRRCIPHQPKYIMLLLLYLHHGRPPSLHARSEDKGQRTEDIQYNTVQYSRVQCSTKMRKGSTKECTIHYTTVHYTLLHCAALYYTEQSRAGFNIIHIESKTLTTPATTVRVPAHAFFVWFLVPADAETDPIYPSPYPYLCVCSCPYQYLYSYLYFYSYPSPFP